MSKSTGKSSPKISAKPVGAEVTFQRSIVKGERSGLPTHRDDGKGFRFLQGSGRRGEFNDRALHRILDFAGGGWARRPHTQRHRHAIPKAEPRGLPRPTNERTSAEILRRP